MENSPHPTSSCTRTTHRYWEPMRTNKDTARRVGPPVISQGYEVGTVSCETFVGSTETMLLIYRSLLSLCTEMYKCPFTKFRSIFLRSTSSVVNLCSITRTSSVVNTVAHLSPGRGRLSCNSSNTYFRLLYHVLRSTHCFICYLNPPYNVQVTGTAVLPLLLYH